MKRVLAGQKDNHKNTHTHTTFVHIHADDDTPFIVIDQCGQFEKTIMKIFSQKMLTTKKLKDICMYLWMF